MQLLCAEERPVEAERENGREHLSSESISENEEGDDDNYNCSFFTAMSGEDMRSRVELQLARWRNLPNAQLTLYVIVAFSVSTRRSTENESVRVLNVTACETEVKVGKG